MIAETANNDWKAGSSASNDSIETNGCAYSNNTVCFSDRAMHAKRAYHEWIPIRAVDLSDEARIFRDFRFGDLLRIAALDTRKYDRGKSLKVRIQTTIDPLQTSPTYRTILNMSESSHFR